MQSASLRHLRNPSYLTSVPLSSLLSNSPSASTTTKIPRGTFPPETHQSDPSAKPHILGVVVRACLGRRRPYEHGAFRPDGKVDFAIRGRSSRMRNRQGRAWNLVGRWEELPGFGQSPFKINFVGFVGSQTRDELKNIGIAMIVFRQIVVQPSCHFLEHVGRLEGHRHVAAAPGACLTAAAQTVG